MNNLHAMVFVSALSLSMLGCGRSVTLRANSAEVLSRLEQMDAARQRKMNVLAGSFVGGMMIANAMADKDSSEIMQNLADEVVIVAIVAGVGVGSLMPDAKLGFYHLEEFAVHNKSWKAVFVRDSFRAKVKLAGGDDQETFVKVYNKKVGKNVYDDFESTLKKWAESL